MKKVFTILAICAIVMMVALGSVQASVSMWFTDAAGNSINELTVAPNATFTIQAWMSTTEVSKGFSLALGYDSSISMGTAASVRDNKLTLATGSIAADVVWGSDMASLYPTQTSFITAGLRALSGSASNSVRPYGLYFARGSASTAVLGNTLIATINLKNLMTSGSQYDMVIWNANTGSTYTSALNLGTTTYPRTSDILTIKSETPQTVVPEPSSIIALMSGLVGIGGLAIRRRK